MIDIKATKYKQSFGVVDKVKRGKINRIKEKNPRLIPILVHPKY